MIRKFYCKREKTAWRYDAARREFYSWGFDIRLADGRRKRESGFGTKQLADAAAARIRLGEKNRKYELSDDTVFPRLSELRDRRCAAVADYAEKIRSHRVLTRLGETLGGDPRINELSAAGINLYADVRHSDGVTDATINRELRLVRAALNQAKIFFDGLENWTATRVAYIKIPKTRRERIVTSDEGRAVLFYLLRPQSDSESADKFTSRRRAGLLFLLSAVTGARPGELTKLKPQDVLYDISRLRITGRKTRFQTAKTVRYIPLTPIVRRIIAEAVAIRASSNFVFTENGTLTRTYYGSIRDACTFAGIDYGRKTDGGLIPYDLRHTATTLLVQSGADLETVSSLTGQSQHSLWHYTHASEHSITRAASVLETFAASLLPDGNLLGDGLHSDTALNLKPLIAVKRKT